MNRKASFVAVSKLLTELSDEELLALVDSPEEVAAFAATLFTNKVENTFFTHLSDNDVPENLRQTGSGWRKLASDLGYVGPVAWRVRAGFTLKSHAPKAGPCYEKFSYLQDWPLQNDESTVDSIVFWIPRLLEDSTSKNVAEQKTLMATVRANYGLPEHHLASFGSAAMLTGLVLAHFKRTGERTPLNCLWARTDTLHAVGGRLAFGDFDGSGLDCDGWSDDDRGDDLGVFPLGVELGL